MRSRTKLLTLAALLAATALPAADRGTEGFLYGRLTTRDGTTYQGRLRWDDEEAFWGDFFNSSKEDNPWVAQAPAEERERRRRVIELFGFRIGSYSSDLHDGDRQFVARFGDITKIEPGHGDNVRVTLKSGTTFTLEGGSNDVEGKVRVWDGSLGMNQVEWRRIRSIELMPAPAGLADAPPRLYGKVATRSGNFTGFVQWDQEECLGGDELDGETRDGDDTKVRVETIRSIARRSSDSSAVTLTDGRELVLSDTNDVDSSNRGIYVEDPRYGRVLVSWDAFLRADFSPGGSGPAYGAFLPGERLVGTVTTSDGRKLTGRLVYDLDESETTEMLDGERGEVSYSIPFALVAVIVPRGEAALVTLNSGEELLLSGTTDVSEDNAGVLVYEPGRARPTYVRWEDVQRVAFAGPRR